MKSVAIGVCLLVALVTAYLLAGSGPWRGDRSSPRQASEAEWTAQGAPPVRGVVFAGGEVPAPASLPSGRTSPRDLDYATLLAEVDAGQFDPLSVPIARGIVWYGTWEDAMAEKERTGKPVMLHFGSPRRPTGNVCVPGTW